MFIILVVRERVVILAVLVVPLILSHSEGVISVGIIGHHGLVLVVQQSVIILIAANRGGCLILHNHLGDQLAVLGDQGVGVLHLHSLERIPDHLGRVVTGQRSGDIHVLQTLIQALLGGNHVDVGVPAVAGEVGLIGAIAQGHQQHLGQLRAGHVASGAESTATHTGHNALGCAGFNVLLCPSVSGTAHVRESRRCGNSKVRLLAAVEGHADHLGDLRPLNVPFRMIGTILIPANNVQRSAHIDGLGVLDLVLIRERRPGAHDHDRQHHSHTEHQAQNLLLGELLIPQCFAPQFPTDFPRRSHAIISIF